MELLDPLRKPFRFWMTGSLAVVMAALVTGRGTVDDEREMNPRRVVRHSRYSVDETAERIEAAARQAGQGIIARVEREGLVIVLASSIGGTPVLMQRDGGRPDVPLAVQVRQAAGGGADVLLASSAQVLLAGDGLPARVAEELAALPGLLDRALG
jgi:fructose-specific component phosphotransferase system IIB-like protein